MRRQFRNEYHKVIFNRKSSALNAVWYGLYVERATTQLRNARDAKYPEVRRDHLLQARFAAKSARVELRDLLNSINN